MRRYEEPVEVRAGAGAGGSSEGAPTAFLWRGRLYVVREVLGHWRERRSWWTGAAAQAVHGFDASVVEEPGAAGGAAGEHEVWRVEASAGRTSGSGVYDLRRPPSPVPGSAWRLARVAD